MDVASLDDGIKSSSKSKPSKNKNLNEIFEINVFYFGLTSKVDFEFVST